MTSRGGWAGAALAALLALGSCTSQSPASVPTSPPPSAPSVSSAPDVPTSSITETHAFADGVTLRVAKITEAKLGPIPETGAPGAKEGDPYVIVTLVWNNRSKAPIELMPSVTVLVGAAGHEAPGVGWDPRDAITIASGESTELDVGFLVSDADRQQVSMEILDALDPSRAVTLTGSLVK